MPLGGRINAPASVGDESVDSDAYVDGSIDLAHMSAESVDSDQYVDGSIDAAHIASNAVTTAKINADAVTGAKIADDAIDSEHYTDGSIDSAHIASGTIAMDRTTLTAGTNITLSTNTLNVDDAFLVNDGNDTTTGTVTAAGFTTSGYITLSDDTPADDTATGIIVTMTALTGLAVGELVHIDANGKLDQAHADAIADMPAIGIALTANSSGSDAEVNVLLHGIYRDDSQFNFTPGAAIHVSDTTEGDFIETAPSSDGDFVQRVGVAITADIIYFNPSLDVIEHA